MGSVQQAVLEFDEAVQAPWRPSFASSLVVHRAAPLRVVPAPAPRRGSPLSRVGRSPAPLGAGPRTGPALPARPAAAAARPVPASRATRRQGVEGAPGVRLSARGRRLVAVLATAAGVLLAALAGAVLDGDGGDLRLAGGSAIEVRPGDTLWDIAASVADGQDVRAVVDEMQRLNGLDGTDVVPGQLLRLP